jgi:hypothetical protein
MLYVFASFLILLFWSRCFLFAPAEVSEFLQPWFLGAQLCRVVGSQGSCNIGLLPPSAAHFPPYLFLDAQRPTPNNTYLVLDGPLCCWLEPSSVMEAQLVHILSAETAYAVLRRLTGLFLA